MQPLQADHSGYLSTATIAALASGTGGALSVVRVSGARCALVLDILLGVEGASKVKASPRLARLCRLKRHDGDAFDEALVLFFQGPNSFTGEDVIEFHVHSSPYVLRTLFDELRRIGVRSALAGEFSFRAVRNGRMSLSQASAVADLIGAQTKSAAELALEKLSGSQNRLVGELAGTLRELVVLSEVGIDFSDQDVDEVSLRNLKSRLLKVQETLVRLRDSFLRGGRIQEGVSVSLLGLPNAGKSSFFNSLLGEDRSIVSEIPGTTRDVVREKITLESDKTSIVFRLADTAGVRDTADAIEKIGVERSLQAASKADLILWMIDGSCVNGQALDVLESHWKFLGEPSERSLGVLTKLDLSQPSVEAVGFFAEKMPYLSCSATTGEGIHKVGLAMVERAGHWVMRESGEVVLTREEDLRCVEEALDHLARAQAAHEEDLFAADLNQALRSLSSLIGSTVPDDILGAIFAGFCIGK